MNILICEQGKTATGMIRRYKIPKTIIWVIHLFFIFLAIFTLYRFITFLAFKPKVISVTSLAQSLAMGLRYDLRWIAFILLPIVLLSFSPRLSPFYSSVNKKYWTTYLVFVTAIVFFFFAAGFGSFSYNKTPLDAGAMNFAEDFRISWKMMTQTYPMFWLLAGLLTAIMIFRWMYYRSHWQVVAKTDGLKIPHRKKYFIFSAAVLSWMAWGSLSAQPLKRNDCFRLKNNFYSYLAINPLQNFFTTLKFRHPEYDIKKVRDLFPVMAEWLELPDKNLFTFYREIGPRSTGLESKPNIILVQCESFSMYKTSMSGNPLNATPFFDSLCRKGIFFERCFTPHFSTARGLFAIITGIPDAQFFKFSTRNPQALSQYTIINNWTDYEKHYFLGGDPEFGNFEGVLKNIDGLKMHVGRRPHIPEVSVWGISDKDLFYEAHEIFKKTKQPFFAYIQTSGNHRPYDKTMAKSDTDFIKLFPAPDTLRKYGFESADEYNSLRYFDYCIRKFIEAAAEEKYFHNTIFVFLGDHGVAGNAEAIYPPVWTEQRLTDEHVPMLFYAPQLLTPQWRSEVVSQIDVLPTIAGMLQQSYVNRTLGRDLLEPAKTKHFAFITNSSDMIGVVTDDFYYSTNVNTGQEQLSMMRKEAMRFTPQEKDSIKTKLALLTHAFFETSKYLIMNNRP